MKRLFVFLFAGVSFYGKTQTFIPVPDSGAVWNETYSRCVIAPPVIIQQSEHTRYFSTGDTLIGNQVYKIILCSGQKYIFCSLPPTNVAPSHTWQDSLAGFIRETSSGQVFFRPANAASDTLLYDYSRFIVGQEFPHCYLYDSIMRLVTDDPHYIFYNIDSVTIHNQVRRRYNFAGVINQSIPDSGAIIEGIGSTKGLLRQLPQIGFEHSISGLLYCEADPGYAPYLFNGSSVCPAFNAIAENQPASGLDVFPNPAHDQFRVSANLEKITALALFNITCELVYRQAGLQLHPASSLRIDCSRFPPGAYLLRIETEQGNSSAQRIFIY